MLCDRGVETFSKRIPNKNKLTLRDFSPYQKRQLIQARALHINYSLSTEIRPEERSRDISVHPTAFLVISGCLIVQ